MPLCTESLSVVTCNKFGSLVICLAVLCCYCCCRYHCLYLLVVVFSAIVIIVYKGSNKDRAKQQVKTKPKQNRSTMLKGEALLHYIIDWRISEYPSSCTYMYTFCLKLKLLEGQDVKPRAFEKDSDIGLNCFVFKYIVLVSICMYWPKNQGWCIYIIKTCKATGSLRDSTRKVLGVCPQHDVIWSGLTVREHLEFFAQAPP